MFLAPTGGRLARAERASPHGSSSPVARSAAAACSAGRDPERAVERRREVDGRARRARGRARRAARRRSRRSARSSGRPRRPRPRPRAPGSAALSSIATGTGDSARTSRSASSAVHRLLAQLEPDRRQRAQVRERLARRAPGAVGVGADRHVGPDRRAHRGEPARVVADPDLDLHAAVAPPRPPRRRAAPRPRGPRRRRAR